MYEKKSFIFLSTYIVVSLFTVSIALAANPVSPILPADNIQDPGALSTPWAGCGPTDSNCYITTSSHNPVTITTLANGLSVDASQVLSLALASGATTGALSSTDWNAFNSKLSNTLNNGLIWVGNATNTATPVTLSGDATISNAGVLTLAHTIAGTKTFTSNPILSTMTPGSVFFAGVGGLISENNTKFFWDNTTERLGIGTLTPSQALDVTGNIRLTGAFMPGGNAGTAPAGALYEILTSAGAGLSPTWTQFNFNDIADARITLQKAIPSGLATLDASGIVPLSQLPATAFTTTYTRDTLNGANPCTGIVGAVQGDVCVANVAGASYILSATPASNPANWVQLAFPSPPVSAVNGAIGNVALTASNGLTYNTATNVSLGGILTGLTTINQAGNNMVFSGAGNFGLGIAPAEKLDVSGNIKFTGALMPAGLSGNANDLFVSAGAGIAPTWQNPATFIANYAVTTADNGITKTGTNTQLGGNLLQNTLITNNGFNLTSLGSSNQFTVDTIGRVFIGPSIGSIAPNTPLTVTPFNVASGRIARLGPLEFTTGADPVGTGVGIRVDGTVKTLKVIGSSGTLDDTVFSFIPAGTSSLDTHLMKRTSGEVSLFEVRGGLGGGFVPTSGNATYNHMSLLPNINQAVGTATGITRGLYINPTLIGTPADYRTIETTVGNVFLNSTSGNTGIGVLPTAQKLQVLGNIRAGASGTLGCLENFAGTALVGTCTSDERLKTNITDFNSSTLEKFADIRFVNYEWNDLSKDIYKKETGQTAHGVLAQNIEALFPDLVSTDDKGYKIVDMTGLNWYAMQSIKELASGLTDTTIPLEKDGKRTFTGKFFDRLTTWLESVENGIESIFVKEVKTEKLCIGNTCISEAQLQQLLDQSNQQSTYPTTQELIPSVATEVVATEVEIVPVVEDTPSVDIVSDTIVTQ